jgi:hypothetical protein
MIGRNFSLPPAGIIEQTIILKVGSLLKVVLNAAADVLALKY